MWPQVINFLKNIIGNRNLRPPILQNKNIFYYKERLNRKKLLKKCIKTDKFTMEGLTTEMSAFYLMPHLEINSNTAINE